MAVTTNTRIDDGGVTHSTVGYLVTDSATAAAHTISLGFVPRYFKITNLTDRTAEEWYTGVASGTSLLTAAAGTRTFTTGNLTLGTAAAGTADQVTIGATFFAASKAFAWEAR